MNHLLKKMFAEAGRSLVIAKDCKKEPSASSSTPKSMPRKILEYKTKRSIKLRLISLNITLERSWPKNLVRMRSVLEIGRHIQLEIVLVGERVRFVARASHLIGRTPQSVRTTRTNLIRV
jgi:hypothetical protein